MIPGVGRRLAAGAVVIVGVLVLPAGGRPANAGGNPMPEVSVITAVFNKPSTTYSVVATDPLDDFLTYQWSHTNARPCGNWTDPRAPTYTWNHPHRALGGDCPEEEVHPGTITVVVSDGVWNCAAVYTKGSAPGPGDAPGTCVLKSVAGPDTAAPVEPSAAQDDQVLADADNGGGSLPVALGGAVVGLVVVGGTTYLVVRRRDAGGAPCDCAALEAAYREAFDRYQRFRDALQGAEENVPYSQQQAAAAAAAADQDKAAYDAGSISFEDYDTTLQNKNATQQDANDAPGLLEKRKAELARIEAELADLAAKLKACGCEGAGQVDGQVGVGAAPHTRDEPVGDAIGGMIEGLAGIGAPPSGGDHPHTVERPPGEEYVQVSTGVEPGSSDVAPDPDRPWTVEQRQAYIWEHWDGAYDPRGEYDFVTGARQDLVNPDYDDDTKRIRKWIISIYEEAYKHSRSQGYENLVAHAYAQIKLEDWKQASLDQFEQAFGEHFQNLGMALSGDPLGNVQKLVAQGVSVQAAKFVPRDQLKGPYAKSQAKVVPTPPKPVDSAPGKSLLLANDASGIASGLRVKPRPGFYDVVCHGEANGFSLKINGKWTDVSAATIADAMAKTGYKSGAPVRLVACDTGVHAQGAAQQLSNILKTKVVAPTGKVWVLQNGELFVAEAVFQNGKWVPVRPAGWVPFTPKGLP